MKIFTTVSYLLFVITYLIVFTSNPGIPGKEYYKGTFIFNKEEDKLKYRECSICNIIIPDVFKVVHCSKCGICIIKQHHHCPWIGKCVGKKNKKIFCYFGCFLFIYIILLIVSFITFLINISEKSD